MNDCPGDSQNRPPLLPQKGDPRFRHQKDTVPDWYCVFLFVKEKGVEGAAAKKHTASGMLSVF